MRRSRWILAWKSNSIPFTVVSVAVLATTVLSAQRTTTWQSSGDTKTIHGMENVLTTRFAKSQDFDTLKMQLTEDRASVEKAGATVVPELKNAGYSDQEAVTGLAWTWYELRVGKDAVPLTTRLSLGIIQQKAAKQGRLIVHSKPNDAAISVDTVEWPSHTDAEGFADTGKRKIHVAKEKLEPADGTCDVIRDRIATFSATLRKKGSTAECK
jgi:hypothetical protein